MLQRTALVVGVAALLGVVALIGGPAQPAAAQTCTVEADPGGGAVAGTMITISGAGWSSGETVSVTLAGVEMAAPTTDGGGGFSVQAAVPSLDAGPHLLIAGNDNCEAGITYQVLDSQPACTIRAEPEGGAAVGETIALAGRDWDPGATVLVSLGGVQIAEIVANAAGRINADAVVPDLPAGDQALTAAANRCDASATYQVLATETTTTTSTPESTSTTTEPESTTTTAAVSTTTTAANTTTTTEDTSTTSSATTSTLPDSATTTDPPASGSTTTTTAATTTTTTSTTTSTDPTQEATAAFIALGGGGDDGSTGVQLLPLVGFLLLMTLIGFACGVLVAEQRLGRPA